MVVTAMEMRAAASVAGAAIHRLQNLRERLLGAGEIAGLKVLAQGLEFGGERGDDRLRARGRSRGLRARRRSRGGGRLRRRSRRALAYGILREGHKVLLGRGEVAAFEVLS